MENKGTIITKEDVVKALQDIYNSMPDAWLDPPIDMAETLKRAEMMRKKMFDGSD